MLYKDLPDDPMVFTMGHELKHHLVDSALAVSYCDPSNRTAYIEIGAEVFAAELIFPEEMFVSNMAAMGVGAGQCKPETIVQLKRESRTTLSYAGLVKRAEFLGFAEDGALDGVKWTKLEEEIYGIPIYKRIRAWRANRARSA